MHVIVLFQIIRINKYDLACKNVIPLERGSATYLIQRTYLIQWTYLIQQTYLILPYPLPDPLELT